MLAEPIDEALADVPVRSVDGDMADAIAALLEQSAKSIALLRGVAFLQEGIAEECRAVAIRSDHLFIFQKIHGEISVTCLLAIKFVRIGMIADEVTRLVPGRDQFGAVGFIHAHAANKQCGANIPFGNRFQDSAVGFLPFQH